MSTVRWINVPIEGRDLLLRRNGHAAWISGENELMVSFGQGEDMMALQSHNKIIIKPGLTIGKDAAIASEVELVSMKLVSHSELADATTSIKREDLDDVVSLNTMPSHRSANCCATVTCSDGKVVTIFFGGFGWFNRKRVSFNDVWTYNNEDGWLLREIAGPKPEPRNGCQAVAMEGNFYLCSGDDGMIWYGDLWKLDTTKWTWSCLWKAASDKIKRSSHNCNVATFKDSSIGEEDEFKTGIVVYGGSTSTSHLNDVMTIHFRGEVGLSDCEVKTRVTFGTQPAPRSFASSVVYNNHLFVFGGYTANKLMKEGRALNDLHALNLSTWTWHEVMVQLPYPLPDARFGHSMTCLDGHDKFIMFGGCDGVSQMFNDVYVVTLPKLPTAIASSGGASVVAPHTSSIADAAAKLPTAVTMSEGVGSDTIEKNLASRRIRVKAEEGIDKIEGEHDIPSHPLGEAFQLASWMKERGLEMYTKHFFELGATSLLMMKEVSESDMDTVGMKPLHKRKLIKEIALL